MNAIASAQSFDDDTRPFVQEMKAMWEHYVVKGSVRPYPLPDKFGSVGVLRYAEVRPDGPVREAVAQFQASQDANFASDQKGVNQALDQLKANQNKGVPPQAATDSFKKKLAAQKEQAKQRSNESIEAAFDKLLVIGEEHPEQQGIILGVVDQLLPFFEELLSQVVRWFGSIAQTVIQWFRTVVQWLDDARKAVVGFFSGAVGQVGDFFRGIFG